MRAARVGLLALAFWPACTPGAGGVVERDSAGVRIVESHGGWDDDVAWTVSDVPTLEIGSPSGSPEDQLESIAVVRELRDGRIALADDRAGRIRVYDADGRNEWASGRPGDGPGEYRLIAGLGEGPGDSPWVWDFTLRRFTILTADGSLARVARMTAPLSLLAIGRLDDGTFVMRESFSSAHAPGRTPGLQREPAAVARISADGALLDTVLLVLGREYHLGEEDGRGVMSAPLFAHEASAALGDLHAIGQDRVLGVWRDELGLEYVRRYPLRKP